MLIFFKKHMLLFFQSSDLNMLFSRRNILKELPHTYLSMLFIMLKKAIYGLKYAASVHGDRALESSSIAFSDHLIIDKGYQAL